MPSFFDLMKYARTGIVPPDMTGFDKLRARAEFGGYPVSTITGVPPISFKSDGKPLTAWSIAGNMVQDSGTKPSPTHPIMPTFCGVRTGNLLDFSTVANGYTLDGVTGLPIASPQRIATTSAIQIPSGVDAVVVTYDSTDAITFIFSLFQDDTLIERTTSKSSGAIIQTKNANKMYLSWYRSGTTVTTGDILNVMVNTGTTTLPYEPYGYKIPLTNAGQTVPIYLGEVPTVRRIKKLVLTGTEASWAAGTTSLFILDLPDVLIGSGITSCLCSHYNAVPNIESGYSSMPDGCCSVRYNQLKIWFRDIPVGGIDNFKSYLADQYAAGHPMTVWYVLATPTTGIVNEPLCKIGDYADELHSTDVAVTIPTVKGANVLTVDTELQPSEMTITFKG